MEAGRRRQALSVFGVVQYRRRALSAASHAESEKAAELTESTPSEVLSATSESPESASSIANSIKDLKAVANELGVKKVTPSIEDRDVAKVADLQSAEEAVDRAPAEHSESARKFELRFWRCGNLLAVETASSEEAPAETKHRLVNNIYRALFGASAAGTPMYAHRWPDEINSGNASDGSAREWLNLFLKGQKAKDPDTKLWLMGRDSVELLLSEHGTPDELEGMRLFDNKLELEVYVTPSLDAMFAKPYLKASTWKLLRTLST